MPTICNYFNDTGDKFELWAFVLLALCFVFALFNHGLVPSMEPRFAEVVREMLATGEWLIPIKNGRPYVEYPPLYYWLGILGKQVGLPMAAAIRLPSYLAFFSWLYVVFLWQKRVAPDLPAYGFALAAAAMPLVLFQFSIAQTDSILACGVALAFYGYTVHSDSAKSPRFPWLLWAGIALATAAKGPVGLACTAPVFALDCAVAAAIESAAARGSRLLHYVHCLSRTAIGICWIRGLSLVLLVTAPWYIIAGYTEGWNFVKAVLIYQNVDRYVTGYSHTQPWWYYFKTFIYDFFPVSILVPFGIVVAARDYRERTSRIILLWALFTFVFFSISGSKQGKYLLPATPAFVALFFLATPVANAWLRRSIWPAFRGYSAVILVSWSLLVILAVPFYSDQIVKREGFETIRSQLAARPGNLVHYQWPRSMTLYELGAPMDFVRFPRELYERIHSGDIGSGDYILVRDRYLDARDGPDDLQLEYPNKLIFKEILRTELDVDVVLLRVVDGAGLAPIPETPTPPPLIWRDALFDTD